VIAGIKNKKTQGARRKKSPISAKPYSKILKGPLKTHRNSPLRIRNNPITKYPIGEVKKDWISLLKIAIILVC
jgi:hypothetical protein